MGQNGQTAMSADSSNRDVIVAQYQTSRIRSFWASYRRIFQISLKSVITLDPGDFRETNRFPYLEIANIHADPTNADKFGFDWNGTSFVFESSYRTNLLCKLFECRANSLSILGSSDSHIIAV